MVKELVKRGMGVFVSRQTNIFSAAFFLMLTTVLAQLLGIVKRRLIISIFGATSDPGIFEAAFRIPDLLLQILIVAAVSSAFIPLFTDYYKENKKEALEFASSVINFGIVIYAFLALFIAVFAVPFSRLIAPGFSTTEIQLMANIMQIVLVSELFFIGGLIATAILQSFHHFLIPGMAASFYNIGIIIATLTLAPRFGIYGVAWGVLLGALLYFCVQLPMLRKVDFSYILIFRFDHRIKRLLHLMAPRSGVILITQLAITTNVFFVSFISARSLFLFDLAFTLMMAPVLLFGQSIAQASFPSLSQKKDNKVEFISIFISSFNQILYLTLPITVLLIVLRIPIVRLIYGASKFDWDATVATGLTLAFFSISVFAQSVIYLFSRAFYALHDTKTPLFITISVVLSNILLYGTFLFFYKNPDQFYHVFGPILPFLSQASVICKPLNMCRFLSLAFANPIYFLALAYSISNMLGVLLFTLRMNKKIQLPKRDLLIPLLKIGTASFIMGVALYVPMKLLDQLIYDTSRTVGLIMLTGVASIVGITSYIFFTWLLDIREAYYVINVLRKLGGWKKGLRQVRELLYGQTLNS